MYQLRMEETILRCTRIKLNNIKRKMKGSRKMRGIRDGRLIMLRVVIILRETKL
jgi:hypothetical protein